MTNPFLPAEGVSDDETPTRECYSACQNPFCTDPGTPREVPVNVDYWVCGGCGSPMPPPWCAGETLRNYWFEATGQTVVSYCEENCSEHSKWQSEIGPEITIDAF